MTTRTKGLMAFTTILTTAACAFGGGLKFNLGELPSKNSIVDETYDGVKLRYTVNSKTPGAYLWGDASQYVDYKLVITSEKPIVKIEFSGVRQSDKGKTADVLAKPTGKFTFSESETSVWEGSATSISFVGASKSTGYIVQTIRIQRQGDEGSADIDVDVLKKPGKDVHYYAQGRNLPYDGNPVTLAVVAHTDFKEALQDYLVWKTQQGYRVVEFYADEISDKTKKTNDALALEIRECLMKLNPKPSYVLLVGDAAQVPYFEPRTEMAGGQAAVTDFFYGEYSGDRFAEAPVGRFSATTVAQLQAQMEKTKYMAFIRPEASEWLHRSVIAHAPASDIATREGAEFGKTFPEKFKDNTGKIMYPTQLNSEINLGSSFVAYLGHGARTYWAGYYASDVDRLKNKGRYPVVLGLTCLSGSFQYDSLAESFMRKAKGGAVAYIGATRESWDGADNLFFMGGNSVYKKFEHIGFMRSLFHPDAEDETQLTRTIGDAFCVGKFASRIIGEYSPFRQFTEFFTLFGDPTYQPYITTPTQMFIRTLDHVAAGQSLAIETAPEAVVCISKGRDIIAVGLANHKGKLTLTIPKETVADNYTIYSSAPFYNDFKSVIAITPFDGGDAQVLAEKILPAVDYTDVIDVNSAASALPAKDSQEYLSSQPQSFRVNSSAEYTMWAGHNLTAGANKTQYQHWLTEPKDTVRCIYLRNQYDKCSFITTASAGNVAYVEVDWLHPCGQAEILGVYGSTSQYKDTTQAWNGEAGKKLGEIRKGTNNRLLIEGDWPYILIRAEDYEGYHGKSSEDQNNVFIKSLTIGWIKGSTANWRPTESGSGDADIEVVGDKLVGVEESSPDGWSPEDSGMPGDDAGSGEFVERDFYLPAASSDEWVTEIGDAHDMVEWSELKFVCGTETRRGDALPANAKVRFEVSATTKSTSWVGYRRIKIDGSYSVSEIAVVSKGNGNQPIGFAYDAVNSIRPDKLSVQGVELKLLEPNVKPSVIWIGYQGMVSAAPVFLDSTDTMLGVGTLNLTQPDSESIREMIENMSNFKGRVIGAEKINEDFVATPDLLLGPEQVLEPGAMLTVKADDASAAITRVKIKPTDTAAEAAGQVALLKLMVTEGEEEGTWVLAVAIDAEKMSSSIDETAAAFGKELSSIAVQSKERATTTKFVIPAESVTPGLYYSLVYADSPDFETSSESSRTLAKPSEALVLEVPADNAPTRFFKVKASMTQHWD